MEKLYKYLQDIFVNGLLNGMITVENSIFLRKKASLTVSIKIGYIDCRKGNCTVSVDNYLTGVSSEELKRHGEVLGFPSLLAKDISSYMKHYVKENQVFMFDKDSITEEYEKIVSEYFEKSQVDSSQIKALIFAGSDKTDKRNLLNHLVAKFSLNSAALLTVCQDCSSWLVAVKLSEALLKNGGKVLILTNSVDLNTTNRFYGLEIISDAIGIIEIKSEVGGLMPQDFIEYYDNSIDESKPSGVDKILRSGITLIEEIAKRNNISLGDISGVFLPSVMRRQYKQYATMLGISENKIIGSDSESLAYLAGADIVNKLSEVREYHDGWYLVCSTSVGFMWNIALFRYERIREKNYY